MLKEMHCTTTRHSTPRGKEVKRMRKASLVILALVFGIAGSANAGDYHFGSTLNCAECHVMHYSQSHGYSGGGTFTSLGPDGPYEYLLRNHVNDLCLTCHDGQTFAPDVLANNTGSAVRQAGALNMDDVAPYLDEHGHTLGSFDVAPGGTWAADSTGQGLECTNCHQPHGYGGPTANPYRNLSPTSGGGFHASVTYAVGTNDAGMDVFERVGSGVNHYDVSNVDFNEPDATDSGYATWCKTCHTNFHGAKGGAEVGGATGEEWVRHPQADADIGALGGGHSSAEVFADSTKTNWVKVMTATENWTPDAAAQVTDHTPSCFTCHKGHGNQNPFGLIYMEPTGTITEEGTASGQYTDLCKQCHVQG
jgi:hypothetical protein